MRRPLHCMIVVLLCLTLFMDTARACWHRRHHVRVDACPPTIHRPLPAARPSWTSSFAPVVVLIDGCPAAAWGAAPLAWYGDVTGIVIDDRIVSQSCLPCADSDHLVLEHHAVVDRGDEVVVDSVIVHDAVEHGVAEHPGDAPPLKDAGSGAQGEAVVVHDPTIVVAVPPKPDVPRPEAGEIPAPKTARPAAPQPQVAASEPLPDLKPATTAPDQPVPASLALPAEPAAASGGKKAMADESPSPVTPGVDDLAATPPKTAAPAEPRERNLFDEFADEAADGQAAGTAEPPEPEMKRESPDEQPAKPAQPAKAAAPDAPDEDTSPAPEEPEATAMIVPDEPMRLWTDSTGDHHAQGWLAELHDDGVVRILKVNGRYTTMAVADLSEADQTYVSDVAARVAGRQPAASAVNKMAGL